MEATISEQNVEVEVEEESIEEKPKKDEIVILTFPQFLEKFKTWNPDEAVRIKDPKAKAYALDQIFWNNPLHHYSSEFYRRVLGFINKAIVRYGMEEQHYDEDLPVQIYNKICEAINSYYDPRKANVVTFLHTVLFNHIKLKGYHIKKYKDGTFYNKYHTYDSIIKSITKSVSTQDLITLDNYFDHLTFIKTSDSIRNYLKDDIIKLAPKNNILFKAVVWELLQNEEMKIGKLSNKFDNARDDKSVAERRYKIRRS